jgi:hypothetical protein
MSDTWLIVFPTDPLATPSEERCEAAFDLICALRPEAEDPELHVSDSPEFFDCGGNFEAVFCPFCAAEVTPWWMEQMDRWWEGDHHSLAVETTCCGRTTSLNDLDYRWPQGFACVAVELMNPDADFEPSELKQIEAALGVPVRLIWRHI